MAEKLTSAARAVIEAYRERETIASELGQLCALGGARVRPGDVTYSKADALVRAASELLMGGGEQPPTLRRDPRRSIHEPVPAA